MRALAITERDLRRFSRNPIVLIASILMPLVYLVIMGNSFQGELKHLPIVVVDQDNGPYARRMLELLQAIQDGPHTLDMTRSSDQRAAIEGVKNGFYKGALIIPPRFSEDVVKHVNPQVGLFLDNTDSISAAGVSSLACARYYRYGDIYGNDVYRRVQPGDGQVSRNTRELPFDSFNKDGYRSRHYHQRRIGYHVIVFYCHDGRDVYDGGKTCRRPGFICAASPDHSSYCAWAS